MRSLWNPRRFLSSIQPWYWGNPQPGRVFKRRMVASIRAFRRPKLKVRFHKVWLPRSAP